MIVSTNDSGGVAIHTGSVANTVGNVVNAAVATPSEEQRCLLEPWQMVDALWGGTRTMRQPGNSKKYLPTFAKEDPVDYTARLNSAVLTNLYRLTVKRSVGRIFRVPVAPNDDVPSALALLLESVDNAGTDLTSFAREVTESAINYGLTHVLVDWTVADPVAAVTAAETPVTAPLAAEATQAAERAAGARPYAVQINPTRIVGWKWQLVNGEPVLTQLRYRDDTTQPDPENEFAMRHVQRVRVLERDRSRLYELRTNSKGEQEWVLAKTTPILMGGKVPDRIPLVTFYANRTDFMQAEPLLLDLAYMNVAHWQSSSDQRTILHVARVPLLFGAGLADDEDRNFELVVGPNRLIRGPQGSTLTYVEHTGKAIAAGETDLEKLEMRMGEMGLDLITRKPGNQTATAKAIDNTESNSPLEVLADTVEDGVNKVLDLFAQWLGMGADAGGTVKINKEFGLSQKAAEQVKALLEARKNGDISRHTFWSELKRAGYLPEDFDPTSEADLLELEATAGMSGEGGVEGQQNRPGDTTGESMGHTHVLEADGFTNVVDGHRHAWTVDGTATSTEDGHDHLLAGAGMRSKAEDNSGQALQDEETDPEADPEAA